MLSQLLFYRGGFEFCILFRNKSTVLKIINFHCILNLLQRLGSNLPRSIASLSQHLIYTKDILFILLPTLSNWSKFLLKKRGKQSLYFYISQSTASIMILKCLKIFIFGKIFSKMFRAAEGIQIGKDRITLNLTRIGDLKMIRIGKHTHHLLTHLLCSITKIDTIPERLTHFCLTICTGESATSRIIRQQDIGFYQDLSVHRIKFPNYLNSLLKHRLLILSNRHNCSLKCRNI